MKKNQTAHNAPGHIVSFFSGVARLEGLGRVFLHEVLLERGGAPAALVIGFHRETTEALFFDEQFPVAEPVYRSGELFSIPLSSSYPGRILTGLGKPMDGLGPIRGDSSPVFRPAPQIIERDRVSAPLTTGIKIIDAALPLGRGQRELIVGDRKLGKSTIAIDTVLNQKNADPPLFCVYVLTGQKKQTLWDIAAIFEKNNATLYTVIVAATAGTSFAEQYLAPFVGCTIGEYFRDRGKDALVIYDDLSKHARAYRDISLLLSRPPGRESYPGDIFSLHAALLERAAKLSKEKGGGSLAALPIIETQEGDITAFIPTNLISITDGQLYVERGLFEKGFIPAINVGLSVSRLGSQVQPPTLKKATGGIRLALAEHRELQKLTQLEAAAGGEMEKKIRHGELMLELLKQDKHTNVSWPEQAVLFFTIAEGLFDDIRGSDWRAFERPLLQFMRIRYHAVLETIRAKGIDDATEKKLKTIVSDFKEEFVSPP